MCLASTTDTKLFKMGLSSSKINFIIIVVEVRLQSFLTKITGTPGMSTLGIIQFGAKIKSVLVARTVDKRMMTMLMKMQLQSLADQEGSCPHMASKYGAICRASTLSSWPQVCRLNSSQSAH